MLNFVGKGKEEVGHLGSTRTQRVIGSKLQLFFINEQQNLVFIKIMGRRSNWISLDLYLKP